MCAVSFDAPFGLCAHVERLLGLHCPSPRGNEISGDTKALDWAHDQLVNEGVLVERTSQQDREIGHRISERA